MKNDLRYIIEYSVYEQINSAFKSNNVYEVVRKAAKLPVTEAVRKSLTIVWDTTHGSIWISVNSYMREKTK